MKGLLKVFKTRVCEKDSPAVQTGGLRTPGELPAAQHDGSGSLSVLQSMLL